MKNTVHLTSEQTEVEYSVSDCGKHAQIEITDRLFQDTTTIASSSPGFLDDIATAFAHAAEQMRRDRLQAEQSTPVYTGVRAPAVRA